MADIQKKFKQEDFTYDDFTYNDYVESDSIKQYQDKLANHETSTPTFDSVTEGAAMNEALNKVLNREKFSYDLNGDALYQQYKDKYITQGKMAMQDTIGQASAMTGGYGNSYAATAGNQAYQTHLQGLNDIIPQLEQLAYERYAQEGNDLKDNYSLLYNQYNQKYGEYQNNLAQWNSDRSYLANQLNNERTYDRNIYDTDRNFAYGTYTNDRNLAYQTFRDKAADTQWEDNYNLSKASYDLQSQQYEDAKNATPEPYKMSNDEESRFFDYIEMGDYDKAEKYIETLRSKGISEEVALSLFAYIPQQQEGPMTKVNNFFGIGNGLIPPYQR